MKITTELLSTIAARHHFTVSASGDEFIVRDEESGYEEEWSADFLSELVDEESIECAFYEAAGNAERTAQYHADRANGLHG